MRSKAEPMDIYSKEGTKVRYVAEGGWDGEVESANEYLTEGEIYTVDNVIVHGWSSDVYLKEVPGIGFNTVMFEDE